MRVTYGKVQGYNVGDTLQFNHATYLDGVIAKYIPGDYEFDLPSRLIELHEEKEYGLMPTSRGVCLFVFGVEPHHGW
ncbi:MAG: S46 family peptidase [Saprospiraceae bacterium]